ncbi:leucine-rich repeat protein [Tanacetum coccineum]
MFPRLYALEACKNLSVASKLSQSCLDFSFRRAPRGGVEQAQLADMLSKLDGVSLVNSSDRWRWSLVGSGDRYIKKDGSLKGAFPADSFGRMVNLRGLHLSSNGLTCPIPESLGRLRLLEELDLSLNQLTGPIPTFIGRLTQLDLFDNLLNGSIPESFGSLTALTLFRVYSNSLTGHVPVSIGQLTKLKCLDISENSLEGVITEAHLAKLSMLKYLGTSSNRPLPTWLRKMPLVGFLDLSHNNLSGPLTNLPNIKTFLNEGSVDVSKRATKYNFTGRKLDAMINVSYSSFSSNTSSEESLNQVMKGVSLEYTKTFKYVINMDLSSNKLVGEIPVKLMSLSALVGLNLSNNHLNAGILGSYWSFVFIEHWRHKLFMFARGNRVDIDIVAVVQRFEQDEERKWK